MALQLRRPEHNGPMRSLLKGVNDQSLPGRVLDLDFPALVEREDLIVPFEYVDNEVGCMAE